RHVAVSDLGQKGLEGREEYPFCGTGKVAVLHGRSANDGRAVNRVLAARYSRNVHNRVLVPGGVKTRVVTKGTLHMSFPRIDVTLEHELRLGGYFYVDRNPLDQCDRFLPDKSGQNHLV